MEASKQNSKSVHACNQHARAAWSLNSCALTQLAYDLHELCVQVGGPAQATVLHGTGRRRPVRRFRRQIERQMRQIVNDVAATSMCQLRAKTQVLFVKPIAGRPTHV
jgi:hypothetical protein